MRRLSCSFNTTFSHSTSTWKRKKLSFVLIWSICKFFEHNVFPISWLVPGTHYSSVLLIYPPWKHQKTCRFSDVLRGYGQKIPGCNWLSDWKGGTPNFWVAHHSMSNSSLRFYSIVNNVLNKNLFQDTLRYNYH